MVESGMKVINNGLVPVYANSERPDEHLVNARELHSFLAINTRYNDWITRRLEEFGFIEGADFYSFLSKSSGGRPSVEYILTLDTAKEIAMVENNERGRMVRRYFIECEKELRNKVAAPMAAVIARLNELERRSLELERALKSAKHAPVVQSVKENIPFVQVLFAPISRAFSPEALEYVAERLPTPRGSKRYLFYALIAAAEKKGWRLGSQQSFYRLCSRLESAVSDNIIP